MNNIFLKINIFIAIIYCLIFISCKDDNDNIDKTNDISVYKGFCPNDKHPHAIDLGFGVKFACCNVGAEKPEDYGGYYSWGEITEKNNYSLGNYMYMKEDPNLRYGYKLIDIGWEIGGTDFDVATAKWGSNWRMPSGDNLKNLIHLCNYKKDYLNGVSGFTFESKNGNKIFLPYAGGFLFGDGIHVEETGYKGNYWSSTLNTNPETPYFNWEYLDPFYLFFGESLFGDSEKFENKLIVEYDFYDISRHCGLSVRPIMK